MSTSKTAIFSIATGLLLAGGSAYGQTIPTQVVTNQPFTPLAYAANAKPLALIPEKNIPWKKRVWREINGNDDKNKDIFIGNDAEHTSLLENILLEGITKGAIKAYGINDGFTPVLSAKEITELKPLNTYKFRVKEDWLFVSNDGGGSGHMEVRILGIAPMMEVVNADGTKTEKAAYWIYYPDCRNFLHQYSATKAKNETKAYTWDEYFEGRNFTSKIDKVFETRDELPK